MTAVATTSPRTKGGRELTRRRYVRHARAQRRHDTDLGDGYRRLAVSQIASQPYSPGADHPRDPFSVSDLRATRGDTDRPLRLSS